MATSLSRYILIVSRDGSWVEKCNAWARETVDPKHAKRAASFRKAINAAYLGGGEALIEIVSTLEDAAYQNTQSEITVNILRARQGLPPQWGQADPAIRKMFNAAGNLNAELVERPVLL